MASEKNLDSSATPHPARYPHHPLLNGCACPASLAGHRRYRRARCQNERWRGDL